MRFRVTRTLTETQIVEAASADIALDDALSYGNQYQWNTLNPVYTVQETNE